MVELQKKCEESSSSSFEDLVDDFHAASSNPTHLISLSHARFNQPKPLSGFLQKKSPALFKSWQKRWIRLCDGQLMYFKQNSSTKDWDHLAGVLNFDLYECELHTDEKKLSFEIAIKGISRGFVFRCEFREELNMWTEALTQSLFQSEGVAHKLRAPQTDRFWYVNQVTERQFCETADTFDIVLFKSKTSGAFVTRTFTGSEFGKFT